MPVPQPPGADRANVARPKLADLLSSAGQRELTELYLFWGGQDAPPPPPSDDELRRSLAAWMSDGETAEARVASLGRRPAQILLMFLDATGYSHSLAELG